MRFAVFILMGMLVAWTGSAVRAQQIGFAAGLTGIPDPAVLQTPVTFQLAVTNITPITLFNVQISSIVSGGGTFISAVNTNGLATNFPSSNGLTNTVVFLLDVLTNGQVADLRYTLRPVQRGTIQHEVYAEAPNVFPLLTNFTTQIQIGVARLNATLAAVPVGSLAGDLLAYRLTLTNAGPDAVLDSRIHHTLPTGLTLLGVDPAGQSFRQDGTNVTLPVGPLAVGAGTMIQLRVQPQVSGAYSLVAVGDAPGYLTPDGTNTPARADLIVSDPGPGVLSATVTSPQVFNPQTGLMDQSVRVRNVGTRTVSAVRVVASGLSQGLFNAAGTNGTLPFVTIPGIVAPGGELTLRLQYFHPTRLPDANPQLSALDVPVPGPVFPIGTTVGITRIIPEPDGSAWLEFPTTAGSRYAILYGDTPAVSRGAALPVLTAPANRIQWQDYGPPLTPTLPGAGTARYYRVIQVTWP